ncbi:MAG: polysaccharide biosynthesis protein [Parcubacteria group bacterium]|nr:polysaccharide biosynthesis protein [Parcubacteria group bacterium]
MKNEFIGKRILVTGGTGTIGSAIVRQLLTYNPKQVRIYSRDESKQFELEQELGGDSRVRFLVGDIRDKERLNMAMENVDIVFHAAALKHVTSCENNPFEAVKTNVQGTQNVIDCAFANDVEKVIGISTDKAASPMSVMGCTKLLAEKIMLATYFYKGAHRTKFCFVRFGNVLGSRGSVVPLLQSQIRQGGPLTITDPSMTRFFMTIQDAVSLVFKAATLMRDREIFIFKMPALKIKDLAKAVVELENGGNSAALKVAIKTIGKRNGERIHEKLLTAEEAENSLETKDMFVIVPQEVPDAKKKAPLYPGAKKGQVTEYSSKNVKKLSVDEIKKMLQRMQQNG